VKLLVTLFPQAPLTSSLLGPNMKNCKIYAYKCLTVRFKTPNACTCVSVNINHRSCVYVCHTYSQSLSASMNPVSLKFLRIVRAELPVLRPECGSFPYQ
jgi:hypothetical protein